VGKVREGSLEGEYSWYTLLHENEYRIFSMVETTIRRGLM
jgi:hypothetical protein